MVSRIPNSLFSFIFTLVLCITLAACLPGKKREERVIAKTQDAMEEVQAEKIAADMINGAHALLGSTEDDTPETDSQNLRTVRCDDGRVMAFIPRDAQITKNGAIPQTVADRMRNQIKAANNTAVIGGADTVASCGGADINVETVALNAPVMILALASSSEDIAIEEEPTRNTMSVIPCGNGQQGMKIVTNGVEDDSLCRDDAGDYFEIETAESTVPNYKAKLAEASGQPVPPDVPPTINFTCIADDNGCAPVNESIEDKVVCKEDNQVIDFMINPEYNKQERRFEPTNKDADCGHGWSGDLITRVIQKECTVYRNGKAEALPGKVINVSYVGARCNKDAVPAEYSCPADATFPNGKVMADSGITMDRPVLLQPNLSINDQGIGSSTLAYSFVDSDTGDVRTNIQQDIAAIAGSPLVVKTVDGESAQSLLVSDMPLGGLSESKTFDKTFVETLERLDNVDFTPQACRVYDQTCSPGQPLEMVAIVLDRSNSMDGATETFIRTETSCRATMADLFKQDVREEACQAAKQYQEIYNAKLEARDQIIADSWSPDIETNAQGVQASDEMTSLLASVDAAAVVESERLKSIMIQALKSKKDQATLETNLSKNQDCYPKYVVENTYGTCSPIHASKEELLAVKFDEWPLKSCQSTCPGICVTDAVERKNSYGVVFKRTPMQMVPSADYSPVEMTNPTLMNKVDNFVRSNLIPNIPAGTKVYYSEFFNTEVDDPESGDVAKKPVEVEFTSSVLTEDDAKQNPDRLYFWKDMAKKVKEKLDARGSDEGAGLTPLYPAIDIAIDQLIAQKLRDDPVAVTSLTVLTDGINNQGPSKYFGENVCDPEKMPKMNEDGSYQYGCTETRHYNCNGNWKDSAGICTSNANCPSGWTNIRCTSQGGSNCRVMLCGKNEISNTFSTTDVRDLFGIETPKTRTQYCQSKFGADSDAVPIYDANPPMGQVDSLVGIIGRNFPETKIFYLGFPTMYGDDGALIAKQCGEETNELYNSYYPGRNDKGYSEQRRILWAFAYEEDVSDSLLEAFGDAVAGRDEDTLFTNGKKICEQLWGNIKLEDSRLEDNPLKIANSENVILPSNQCEVSYMRVDTPNAPDLLPPHYVPNPATPPKADSPIYSEPPECVIAYDNQGNPTYIHPGTMQEVDPSYCDGGLVQE